jgi:trimeric autotransporter adhesin
MIAVLGGAPSGFAQQLAANNVTVPRLIRFSGVLKDSSGKPVQGIAGVTFALYKDQEGGGALWLETQNVSLDAAGRYSVLLGATKEEGVPMDLFSSGAAQWLGVHVRGHPEQPRVWMVSVPYALKAADAETLGGLPASAFVLAARLAANLDAGQTPSPF